MEVRKTVCSFREDFPAAGGLVGMSSSKGCMVPI